MILGNGTLCVMDGIDAGIRANGNALRFFMRMNLVAWLRFVMLVLKVGSMLNVAFETVLLLYQPATYETADVISTYVYRTGMLMQDFGLATAVGLFNAVVGFILVYSANRWSKKVTQ